MLQPSGTMRMIIEKARENAAKRRNCKLKPEHVAEEILKTAGGKAILVRGFGDELDPDDLLHDIQELMIEGGAEITPADVTLDAHYEQLMATASGKAMANSCDLISTRCVLAAIVSIPGPLTGVFNHYGLTEAALDDLIVPNAKLTSSRQLAAASS